MRVFLDVDGVLADWGGGVHRAIGVPYDPYVWPYKKGPEGWNWHEEIGWSFKQVSELCTFDFWENLDWTVDGHDILQAILEFVSVDQITLLTTPMPNIMSASGKMAWMEKNLPAYRHQVCIFTGGCTVGGQPRVGKELFAQIPGTVLIDDNTTNVTRWVQAGGRAILVPRWWNNCWPDVRTAAISVQLQLESLCRESS